MEVTVCEFNKSNGGFNQEHVIVTNKYVDKLYKYIHNILLLYIYTLPILVSYHYIFKYMLTDMICIILMTLIL